MAGKRRLLQGVVRDIRERVARGLVWISPKAEAEADNLGFEAQDVVDVLAGLQVSDYDHALRSIYNREWMFVFKPDLMGLVLYVKVVLRRSCVVVSFHDDDDEESEDGEYEQAEYPG